MSTMSLQLDSEIFEECYVPVAYRLRNSQAAANQILAAEVPSVVVTASPPIQFVEVGSHNHSFLLTPPAARRKKRNVAASPNTSEKSTSKRVKLAPKHPTPRLSYENSVQSENDDQIATKDRQVPVLPRLFFDKEAVTSSPIRSRKQRVKKKLVVNDSTTEKKPKRKIVSIIKKKTAEIVVDVKVKIENKEMQKAAKGSSKLLGLHVSASGGVYKAVIEAATMGCRSFALFTRNGRRWNSPALLEGDVEEFRKHCQQLQFDAGAVVVAHGSYIINCASSKPELLAKSRAALQDEVSRCEKLGIGFYNFHPGSPRNGNRADAIALVAASIDLVHKNSKNVIILIENMASHKVLGGKFEDLRSIIELVNDKTRIGVCIDTCHAFAAGYDLKTPEGYARMMSDLETVITWPFVKAVHLNDSQKPCGSFADRHEIIGKGKIGWPGFERLMNDTKFDSIPMILEIPDIEEHGVPCMIKLYGQENGKKKSKK